MIITRFHRHAGAAAAGVAALLVSLGTLAPTVDFIDAGELATVAYTFGIAHPTGYPLFTILAGLWSHLPAGEPIVLLNVLAAILAAGGVTLLVHLLWFLLGLADAKPVTAAKAKQKGAAPARKPAALPDDMRLALAMFGALCTAFSETWWKTSLSIEVYSLHLPMVVASLYLFVTALYDTTLDAKRRGRRFLLFAFVFGLSFANHMTTIYLVLPFLVVYLVKEGWTAESRRRIAGTFPAFLAGLLPYLYLPLRAASGPLLNWGNPDTLERLFWHVRGKQYTVWMFVGSKAASKQITYFLSTFPAEFAWIGLPLVLAGAVFAYRRHRNTGRLLLLLFAVCVLWAINYDIHDIDSYFLLAYLVSGMWCAYGLWALLHWTGQLKPAVLVASAAVLVGIGVGMHWGGVSERDNHLVDDYTHNMFNSVKKNALVLSYQWDYWVSASLYYQHVRGERPDITVIDKELLRRSWYFDQLRRTAPEAYRRSETEIQLFLSELKKWERDEPYDAGILEVRYNALIASFVARNIADRPVYMTIEMEQHLAPDYERVPEGLALRLYPKTQPLPSPDEPVWDDFIYRPYGNDDPLIGRMIVMYSVMLINRGVYLHKAERYAAAAPYFERALRFDASSRQGLYWKQQNAAAMQMASR